MASRNKAELQAAVLMLDSTAEVETLTNRELEELLLELEAKATPATHGYAVAAGQAILTLGGFKLSGEELELKHFVNGQMDIDALIKSGFVVELT